MASFLPLPLFNQTHRGVGFANPIAGAAWVVKELSEKPLDSLKGESFIFYTVTVEKSTRKKAVGVTQNYQLISVMDIEGKA